MADHPGVTIHETACVDEPCTLGKGTHVWHFTHIRSGAVVGERCNIGQGVYVGKDVRIGNGCKIQNNVSVYEAVTLQDEVFVGPSAVFTNVINPRAAIERKNEFLPTMVKQGATIGANATIVCGITIGEYAFIGAGAVVTKDVPAFALMTGVPAQQTGWMSRAGHRLTFGRHARHCACPGTGELYVLEAAGTIRLAGPPVHGESPLPLKSPNSEGETPMLSN